MRNSLKFYYLLCFFVMVYCISKAGLIQADAANLLDANLNATLLVEAYNPDGSPVSLSDFIDYTFYFADSSKKWEIAENYGVFPLGTPPAIAQSGSQPFATNRSGRDYIAFTVPANQPLYFTCLWKAPNIGTVFMRADNEGIGFLVPENQSHVLQLPYDFALSEYHKMNQIFTDYSALGYTFSASVLDSLPLATAKVEKARSEANQAARVVASYEALSVIMPLKERLVLEICDHSIIETGYRPDFVLNFNGFGSWTNVPFYYTRAKEAGFTFVHAFCDWDRTSPAKGVYDFSYMDNLIDQAISLGFSVALNVVPSVGALPQWTNGLSFDELRTLYYENARLVVDRYKDKVALIYPVHEPELSTRGYNIDQIAELAKQALKGARDAAPTKPYGIFLSASAYVGYQMNRHPEYNLLSSWDFINYVSQSNIEVDFFGLQMQYATIFAPVDLQRIYEHLRDVYNAVKKPIYIAETTYSSKTGDYGIQAQFSWHDGLTQLSQAEWADGMLRISYGNTFIKGLSWTHLDPDNNAYSNDFLSSLIGSNLMLSDGTPKAAYFTFKNFMTINSPPPLILTTNPQMLPNGIVGTPYFQQVTLVATGGSGSYNYSCLGSGVKGMSASISGNICTVSGTPSSKGTFTVSFNVTDSKTSVNASPILVTVSSPPRISVSPMAVNFGKVKVGGTSTPKTVTIKNTGVSDLIIDSINLTGTNYSEFVQTNDCTNIPSGSSCSVNVTFTPLLPFVKKIATMSISSSDPKKPLFNIKLLGLAPPPKISVSPMSVNFGPVPVGSTSTSKIVTIKNTGVSDLVINSITITGTNANEFTHTGNCTTVAKGSSCTITVSLSPISANTKTAEMSISSNDPKKSSVNVKLTGKGI